MSMPIERKKWSDVQFDQILWHDIQIHGMVAILDRYELCFDIDLIVEWLCPTGKGPIQFQIVPSTLVFKSVSQVKITIDSHRGDFSINEVLRNKLDRLPGVTIDTWQWLFKCHEGEISFKASGFDLFLRRAPIHSDGSFLNVAQRGEPSFDRLAK